MFRSPASLILNAYIILLVGGCAQETHPILENLAGKQVNLLADGKDQASVFIFMRTDCPIGNRYAPEIIRIFDEFKDQNIGFYLIYPQANEAAEQIRQHLQEYRLPIDAYRDPQQNFAAWIEATTMPEVAVMMQDGELIYRGRIDDRYVDFGQARAEPTSRDLYNVLTEVAAGKTPPQRFTEAVGCYIEPLKRGSAP